MAEQRDPKEWQQQVAAWRASGASAASFAKQRGYSVSSLRRWSRLRPEPGFVRLEVRRDVDSDGLTVRVGDAAVRVRRGFDAALLREIVDALSKDAGS